MKMKASVVEQRIFINMIDSLSVKGRSTAFYPVYFVVLREEEFGEI